MTGPPPGARACPVTESTAQARASTIWRTVQAAGLELPGRQGGFPNQVSGGFRVHGQSTGLRALDLEKEGPFSFFREAKAAFPHQGSPPITHSTPSHKNNIARPALFPPSPSVQSIPTVHTPHIHTYPHTNTSARYICCLSPYCSSCP